MGKNLGKSASHKKRLSLQKFAGIGKSKYDRKAKAEKRQAINAKRVNKYRKLKSKLLGNETNESNGVSLQTVHCEGTADDLDTERAKARAGPPPEEADEVDNDMIGEASSSDISDGGNDFEGQAARAEAGFDQDAVSIERRQVPSTQYTSRQNEGGAGIVQTETHPKKPRKRQKREKPPSQLQRLAAKVSLSKEEELKAAALKAKEVAQRHKKLQKAERHRKKRREAFLKKTKKGQPVMKHRINNLLSKLQADQ